MWSSRAKINCKKPLEEKKESVQTKDGERPGKRVRMRKLLRMISDVYNYLGMGFRVFQIFNDVDGWLTRSRIDTVNDNHQSHMWGYAWVEGTWRGGTRGLIELELWPWLGLIFDRKTFRFPLVPFAVSCFCSEAWVSRRQ